MSLVVGGQHAVSINNIVSEINEKKKKDAYLGFNLDVMVMMMCGRSSSPSSSFLFPTVSNHLKEKKKDWKKRTVGATWW